ncbi:hypothetical protein HYQ46_005051 [Verticillium longisporum]|nr:hypothetical protein HYQ46_005051 [Verticillium longisporum]
MASAMGSTYARLLLQLRPEHPACATLLSQPGAPEAGGQTRRCSVGQCYWSSGTIYIFLGPLLISILPFLPSPFSVRPKAA